MEGREENKRGKKKKNLLTNRSLLRTLAQSKCDLIQGMNQKSLGVLNFVFVLQIRGLNLAACFKVFRRG